MQGRWSPRGSTTRLCPGTACGAHEAHVRPRARQEQLLESTEETAGSRTAEQLRTPYRKPAYTGNTLACVHVHTPRLTCAGQRSRPRGPPRTLLWAHWEVALARTWRLMKSPGTLYAPSTSLPVLSPGSHRRPGETESLHLCDHPTCLPNVYLKAWQCTQGFFCADGDFLEQTRAGF